MPPYPNIPCPSLIYNRRFCAYECVCSALSTNPFIPFILCPFVAKLFVAWPFTPANLFLNVSFKNVADLFGVLSSVS